MSAVELRNILYVEDDAIVRTTAKITLEMLGRYTVCECDSGRAALRAAQHFLPDLILLDEVMPMLDGIATLALLRRMPLLRETPVMFLTACTDRAHVQRYTAAGAIGVIPKPFDPQRLTAQLRALWEHRPALAG